MNDKYTANDIGLEMLTYFDDVNNFLKEVMKLVQKMNDRNEALLKNLRDKTNHV